MPKKTMGNFKAISIQFNIWVKKKPFCGKDVLAIWWLNRVFLKTTFCLDNLYLVQTQTVIIVQISFMPSRIECVTFKVVQALYKKSLYVWKCKQMCIIKQCVTFAVKVARRPQGYVAHNFPMDLDHPWILSFAYWM